MSGVLTVVELMQKQVTGLHKVNFLFVVGCELSGNHKCVSVQVFTHPAPTGFIIQALVAWIHKISCFFCLFVCLFPSIVYFAACSYNQI